MFNKKRIKQLEELILKQDELVVLLDKCFEIEKNKVSLLTKAIENFSNINVLWDIGCHDCNEITLKLVSRKIKCDGNVLEWRVK